MSEFKTDFNGFKTLASEFFKKLKNGCTEEQADNGFKCLGIAYLNMTGTENELHQARITLDIATRKMGELFY